MKLKHKIALFIAYFVLFLVCFALIDYYAYWIISPKIIITVSLIASAISTYIHIKRRERSQIDELAKKIEEIL
jgi:Flp pilus assembly protein TadB